MSSFSICARPNSTGPSWGTVSHVMTRQRLKVGNGFGCKRSDYDDELAQIVGEGVWDHKMNPMVLLVGPYLVGFSMFWSIVWDIFHQHPGFPLPYQTTLFASVKWGLRLEADFSSSTSSLGGESSQVTIIPKFVQIPKSIKIPYTNQPWCLACQCHVTEMSPGTWKSESNTKSIQKTQTIAKHDSTNHHTQNSQHNA